MKAARYYGPGDVRVEEVPEPQVKDNQIKIKVAWNGICGSDLHSYLAAIEGGMSPTATEPNKVTGETLPITLGHEFSGTIVELGSSVDKDNWKSGQKVTVEPVLSCLKTDTCVFCARGTRNVCPDATFIGIGGWGGGLSEYIAVDTRYVHILPDDMSLEVGAMIEPLAVAYYAVKKSNYQPGETVLIVGGGPIGLFLLKVLRSIDPNAIIIVSEPAAIRRTVAEECGASVVINPLQPSDSGAVSPMTVSGTVLQMTGGRGVDKAFDAAGIQAGLDAALYSLRPQGMLINVAIWEDSPKLFMNLVVVREITIIGTIGYSGIHPELIEAVAAGKITGLESLITKKIAIENVVEQGILALLNEKDKHVKILVHP